MLAHAADDHAPPPMQPAPEVPRGEWLPLAEAARQLGVSIDTVRRRLKRHELPQRKVPMQGGHRWEVFVPLDDGAPAQPTPPLRSVPG